jgi:hypothetical protein
MKTDTKETRIHKPPSPLFTREPKFIVAQILYMQDRRLCALETPGLVNNPLPQRSHSTTVMSAIRLQLLSFQPSNRHQMVISNGH